MKPKTLEAVMKEALQRCYFEEEERVIVGFIDAGTHPGNVAVKAFNLSSIRQHMKQVIKTEFDDYANFINQSYPSDGSIPASDEDFDAPSMLYLYDQALAKDILYIKKDIQVLFPGLMWFALGESVEHIIPYKNMHLKPDNLMLIVIRWTGEGEDLYVDTQLIEPLLNQYLTGSRIRLQDA